MTITSKLSIYSTQCYLCVIIKMVHVPSKMSLLCIINGCICKFCLICHLSSLNNPFCAHVYQTYLRFDSEVDLVQVYDLKRRPILGKKRMWAQIFGHINTSFLQVRDDMLFCWISTFKDFSPLFTLLDLYGMAIL